MRTSCECFKCMPSSSSPSLLIYLQGSHMPVTGGGIRDFVLQPATASFLAQTQNICVFFLLLLSFCGTLHSVSLPWWVPTVVANPTSSMPCSLCLASVRLKCASRSCLNSSINLISIPTSNMLVYRCISRKSSITWFVLGHFCLLLN